jgi:predicted transcriptional regulator
MNVNKYNNCNYRMLQPLPRNRIQIRERRENVLVLLTKGMKGYEIAKELGVDASTVSRDIQYLIGQSQNYLNSLAKETLPFMYQTSIEGIRNVLKECWSIYTLDNHINDNYTIGSNKEITWFHKLAALKLAKECNEALFRLTAEGPSVMQVKLLEERLARIEARKINQ